MNLRKTLLRPVPNLDILAGFLLGMSLLWASTTVLWWWPIIMVFALALLLVVLVTAIFRWAGGGQVREVQRGYRRKK